MPHSHGFASTGAISSSSPIGKEKRMDFGQTVRRIDRIRDADRIIFTERGMKSARYYYSDQISAKQSHDFRENSGGFPHSQNLIRPKINVLLGTRMQNRTDSRVLSRKNDEADDMALIDTQLIKDVDDKSHKKSVQKREFFDLVVKGRCHRLYFVDRDRNPAGQLLYKHLPAESVHPSPDSRDELFGDLTECAIDIWMTPQDILEKYGDKLSENMRSKLIELETKVDKEWDFANFGDNAVNTARWFRHVSSDHEENRMHHLILVVEWFFIKEFESKMIANGEEEFEDNLSENEFQNLTQLSRANGKNAPFRFQRRQREVWQQVLSQPLGKDFLVDEKYEIQPVVDERVVLPVTMAADGRNEDFYHSRVFQLIPTQDLRNRLLSAELEYIAKGPKGVYWFQEDSIVEGRQYVEDNLAKPGFSATVKKGFDMPKFVEAPQLPSGISVLKQDAGSALEEESGIPKGVQGQAEAAAESGILRELKIIAALTSHKDIFDLYNEKLNRDANMIMSLTPEFYTLAETIQITAKNGDVREIEINSQTYDGMVNDMSRFNYREYKAVVTQIEESPTHLISIHEDISEAMRQLAGQTAGLLLLKDWYLTSTLPDKEERSREIDLVIRQQIGLDQLQQQQAQARAGLTGAQENQTNAKAVLSLAQAQQATQELSGANLAQSVGVQT